jgi:hypothetical protein
MRAEVLFAAAGMSLLAAARVTAEPGPEPVVPAAPAATIAEPTPSAAPTATIATPPPSAAPTATIAPPAESVEEDLSLRWGDPFRVIWSVERLLVAGPYGQSGDLGSGGMSIGALVFAKTTADDAPTPFLPHLVPRLAIDLELDEGITVGAVAGFGLGYGSLPNTGSSDSDTPTPKAETYLAGGRVGVITQTQGIALWGRIGVSHAWATSQTESSYGEVTEHASHQTTLDLDGVVLLPCTDYFAVTLGISGSFALRGSLQDTPPEGFQQTPAVRRDLDAFTGWLGIAWVI